jgi:hypothetical protein
MGELDFAPLTVWAQHGKTSAPSFKRGMREQVGGHFIPLGLHEGYRKVFTRQLISSTTEELTRRGVQVVESTEGVQYHQSSGCDIHHT